MAKRGSTKQSSLDQENYIALVYEGRRSPSSGAAVHDAGDVRTEHSLIECKTTGGPGLEKQPTRPSYNQILNWLEGAAQEAWEEGRDPAVAIRTYCEGHSLADPDGWVDLTIRLTADDCARERAYAEVHKG